MGCVILWKDLNDLKGIRPMTDLGARWGGWAYVGNFVVGSVYMVAIDDFGDT